MLSTTFLHSYLINLLHLPYTNQSLSSDLLPIPSPPEVNFPLIAGTFLALCTFLGSQLRERMKV